jgi:AAA family ATP:ADP antiporter
MPPPGETAQRIRRRLLPEARELRDALWLGSILFTITSSYTLVKIARDTLFLSVLPARMLPFVFLVVGVVTLGVSWAFGRLTQHGSPLRILSASAAVSAVVLFAFAYLIGSGAAWVPIAFYAWVNVYGLILVTQFWNFTNSASDPREAKHIFGIIGAGGILGGLAGAIAAAGWASHATPQVLTLAAGGMLAVLVVVVLLAVRRGAARHADEEPIAADAPVVPLMRVPYVRWLAIAALCSVVVAGLLDFQLKTVVQELYPGAVRLTSFFARYNIAMNIAALVLQILGTRWLLERLGAGATAAFLPTGLAVTSVGMLMFPGFASILIARLWENVMRFSLNRSTTEMFYFPLEPGLRRRAKAFIETGIDRVGDALSGLIILTLGLATLGGRERLAAAVLLAAVAWLLCWWQLRRGYVRQLGRQLQQLNLEPAAHPVSLRERGVLKEMVRSLDRRYEGVVLQAIDLLEDQAPRLLTPRLPRLLEHPSPRVRARALTIAAAHPSTPLAERVGGLARDPDPMVRLQALRLRLATGRTRPLAALAEFLDAADPGVRGTALACLVEYGTPADPAGVHAQIVARLADGPVDRMLAIEALGTDHAAPELYTLLAPLLHDRDPEVRRAALRAAGRARLREHVAVLIGALGDRETEPAARAGLVAFGEGVVGTLGDWLADTRTPIEVRRIIPRVLREIPTQDAVGALFRASAALDVVLGYRVLKAANALRIANPALRFPAEEIGTDLDRDVRAMLAASIHAMSLAGPTDKAGGFLLLVLLERSEQAFERVFRRLALLYPPEAMHAAYHGLRSSVLRVRGSAAEYVETALSDEHRALVAPLLPDAPPDDRLAFAKARYGLEPVDPETTLRALAQGEDQWLRACALHVAGARRQVTLAGEVQVALDDADPRVRETAVWARAALAAGLS